MAVEHIDSSTLTRLCRNGDILRKEGDFARADIVLEFAASNSIRVLGEDDTDTLGAIYLLADTKRALGDITSALELEEAYVQGMVRTRGMDDRDTLIAMSDLAETLRGERDLDRAKSVANRRLQICSARLGPMTRHAHRLHGPCAPASRSR
ncbi:MAG: tetratricopeptide repeat protein [Caulobacteraceae bacterium]|nr:tetratricopeptide repeat protein [Caulobacteraceae bacterium]